VKPTGAHAEFPASGATAPGIAHRLKRGLCGLLRRAARNGPFVIADFHLAGVHVDEFCVGFIADIDRLAFRYQSRRSGAGLRLEDMIRCFQGFFVGVKKLRSASGRVGISGGVEQS
jgi:hypothetical protein